MLADKAHNLVKYGQVLNPEQFFIGYDGWIHMEPANLTRGALYYRYNIEVMSNKLKGKNGVCSVVGQMIPYQLLTLSQ